MKSITSTLAAFFVLAVIAASCKKTVVNDYYCDCDTLNCVTTPPKCTDKGFWAANYASEGGGLTWVGDSTFIANGIAKLHNSPYAGTFFSGYTLFVPACRNINADSLKWEVRLKNPVAEGAIEQLDVALGIKGVNDTAFAYYVGRASHQSYNYLGFYNSSNRISNVPELVKLFTDWTVVSVEIKNEVLSTYINGVLVKSYTLGTKKLGRLKELHVGFKGTGSLDWAKAYNQAGTVLLKEEFNSGNKSNVEWNP